MNGRNYLKIAMLGHKRIPSREGGIEVVVEELATRMVERGHKVTCYNRSGHHVSGKEYDSKHISAYKGVNLKNIPTIDIKGFAAMSSSILGAFFCVFKKYDIIHFHAEGSCAMLWLLKLFKKRCIVTIHGIDWQRAKWGWFASKYIKFCEKIVARYADEIIVLSKNVQNYFLNTYGRNTVVIPNGVSRPTKRETNFIKKNFNLEKDSYILYLGRLVPEKGVAYLLEAFKQVKSNKKLVIAGGTSDTDLFIKELKRISVDDNRIIFTGFVQGEILDELYSNAYLYCLPSDLEGMPLSLLEALSYGNCSIVSNIAECIEVVEDKAITFNRGNIIDLKEKLQMLCDDKNSVDRFKNTAADFICNKYNWEHTVDNTLMLYRGEDWYGQI